MEQKTIQKKNNNKCLVYLNANIKICLMCGNSDVEFLEYGVSCEECGTTFGRTKCLQN